MEKWGEDINLVDGHVLQINQQLEEKKEDKFVNLIIEVIVQATLKEYYEKGN
jgi:hypothetical protein